MTTARYTAAFGRHGIRVGQVLLTTDDMTHGGRYRNAQRTLARLLEVGVLPVVNENDTVATERFRFGDNDRLAALVAHATRADALLLLSDVGALYDGEPTQPGARRIPEINRPEDLDQIRIGRVNPRGVGTGGMTTKVEPARVTTAAGIPAVVTGAADAHAVLAGEGTSDSGAPAPFVDQAEERVLWHVEAVLERTLVAVLRPDYASLLSDARRAVRDEQ